MKKRKCLVLDSKPCLFYIHYYGWRGLIFCFQKILQSKIFQARFRAFKVLLLRSFLYKQFSTINFGNFFVVFKKTFMKWYVTIQTLDRRKNTALSYFWKFYSNVLPDFEGSYFYTPKIGKQSRKKSPNSLHAFKIEFQWENRCIHLNPLWSLNKYFVFN
jgi:hypothetical protein